MGDITYYNYSKGNTLEISGTPIYPYSNDLIWVHSDYGVYFVRHDDQTKLVKTTDEGATDCENIDLTGATSKKIQAGWLDGNDLWLLCCDNPDDEFTVIYIELDNSDNVVDVGDSSGADAGTVSAYDIFKIGSNHYVFNHEEISGVTTEIIWDVDSAPFVNKDFVGDPPWDYAYVGVIVGDKWYNLGVNSNGAKAGHILEYDASEEDLSVHNVDNLTMELPDRTQWALSYDGDDTIYLVYQDSVSSKNYLASYSISSEEFTTLGEYNIALMSDRNVHGTTPPFTLEKGFHISEDKIYQIPPFYNGRLRLISIFDFEDTIKAITDRYVIDASGNLYEMIDKSEEIYNIKLHYKERDYHKAEAIFTDQINISNNQFFQFQGIKTTSGASATGTIFEGMYELKNQKDSPFLYIDSPAKEIDTIRPIGNFAGSTDARLASMINASGNYVHTGALQGGTIDDSYTLKGDITLRSIFEKECIAEGWTWYFDATGGFYANNGKIESSVVVTGSDKIGDVEGVEV